MDIPGNWHNQLIDTKPCNFDPHILPDLILQRQFNQEKNKTCPYFILEGGQDDWEKVTQLYSHSKISGYEVAKVEVIVNPLFSQEFAPRLRLLEERGKQTAFQPDWEFDAEEAPLRKKVLKKLMAKAQSPEGCTHTKVVAMFHGPKKRYLDSIFCGNLANLAKTDAGYFGNGVYHTSSAQYAYKYTDKEGQLLMNWICFSSVYPVIHHPSVDKDVKDANHPQWKKLTQDLKKKHWVYLTGRQGPISGTHNAHYALVCSKNPNDPEEMEFYPSTRGEEYAYDELVSFDVCQVLPRYLITLGPDLGHAKSLYHRSQFHHLQKTHLSMDLVQTSLAGSQPLTNEELIELGYLLYLERGKDVEVKKKCEQSVKELRLFQQIHQQHRVQLPIHFNEIFKEYPSNGSLAKAGAAPFLMVQEWIDKENFQLALTTLIALFNTDANASLCYTYLFPLIPHIKDWEEFSKNLPYLLARSKDCIEHQRQLAIELATYFGNNNHCLQAMSCYGKALSSAESNKLHQSASRLYLQMIQPYFEELLKGSDWESVIENVNSWQRLFLTTNDKNYFYTLLLKRINKRINQQQVENQIKEKILQQLQQPLQPPPQTTTQRYWQAFKKFRELFSKEISNLPEFQAEARKRFIEFFDVLLNDAFLILGPVPCNYEIRLAGSVVNLMGGWMTETNSTSGECSLSTDVEFVLLMSQKDPYFQSLQEILSMQLLVVGLKGTFSFLSANEENQDVLLRTIPLATNEPQLFIDYQSKYTPSYPVFKGKKTQWQADLSLDSIKQHYYAPLMQFLSDLALYFKKEASHIYECIDLFPFKKSHRVLLKECVAFFYRLSIKVSLSDGDRQILQKYHWLLFSPLWFSHQRFAHLPNSDTEFQSYRQFLSDIKNINQQQGYHLELELAQFRKDVQGLFVQEKTEVKVTGSVSGYLPSHIQEKLIDEKGNIFKQYTNAAHPVCQLGDFHFKQDPTHPLMEYAIHSLTSRIAGELTPCVDLVRFDVGNSYYPVLISRSIPGSNWAEEEPLDLKQWTWMLLCAVLTRPNDGRFSNYIVHEKKIYCVDNDLSFVEPATVSLFKSEIHFLSLAFCMQPLGTTLDQEVLNQFAQLDRAAILDSWMEDLIEKEKEYLRLFSAKKQQELCNRNPNPTILPILFKEGAIAALDLQFYRLQEAIRQSSMLSIPLTSGDLLKELISTSEETVGSHVHQAYSRAMRHPIDQRKEIITSVKNIGSITAAQYQETCFGKKISYPLMKTGDYSAQEARKELFFSLVKDEAKQMKRPNRTTVQANFIALSNDINRQESVLKALEESLNLKPEIVILTHCTALHVDLLIPFLHTNVEYLDLRFCTNIDDESLYKIEELCPNIKELYLNGTGIKTFETRSWFPLEFPHLEQCDLSDCEELQIIKLKAPKLQTIKAQRNLNLKTIKVEGCPLTHLDHTGSLQAKAEMTPKECGRACVQDWVKIVNFGLKNAIPNSTQTKYFLSVIEHVLTSEESMVRSLVTQALFLVKAHDPSLKKLIEGIVERDLTIEIKASALTIIQPDKAIPLLKQILNDSKTIQLEREAAVTALGLIARHEFIPIIEKEFHHCRYETVTGALCTIGSANSDYFPPIVFGKEKWSTYLGDTGVEPPLPKNIHEILLSPCPFWKDKKVGQTHIPVLIPETVNGAALTQTHFSTLINSPVKAKKDDIDQVRTSYWVLMPIMPLPDSLGCGISNNWLRGPEINHSIPSPYRMPYLREAAICFWVGNTWANVSSFDAIWCQDHYKSRGPGHTELQAKYRQGGTNHWGDQKDVFDGYKNVYTPGPKELWYYHVKFNNQRLSIGTCNVLKDKGKSISAGCLRELTS